MAKAQKSKATEKEKVLPVSLMSMKSFVGKPQQDPKKSAKPGLFDKLKGSKGKKK